MNKPIDFYDIYDYIHIPFWKTKFFVISMLIIFTIIIVISTYYWFSLLHQKKTHEKQLTIWDKTLQKLSLLTPQTYETKEDFKLFYFDLTTITKNYLQKRFHLNLIEKTDDELIPYLNAQHFDISLTEKLEKVLQGSLHIKFANAQALQKQATDDLATIIDLIKQTIPREQM